MGLFRRIGFLLSANLNDLVDQCENPEKMLRQAVREMEAALGRLLDGAARAIAHQRLLSRQLEHQRREVDRRHQAAEAAVARRDDEAARRELRYKAEHQRLAEGSAQQLVTAEALSRRLRSQVTMMRIKLAEARRKLLDLTARSQAAAARRRFVENIPDDVWSGGVVSNFERMCIRVEQSEAETEALLELLGVSDDATDMDADIEAELDALREKAKDAAP